MPLIRGYSEKSLHHNIRDMRARHPLGEALGAAYDIGRTAWKKRYPHKPYPAYLQRKHQTRHHAELQAEEKTKTRRTRNRATRAARPKPTPRRGRNPIRRHGARELYTGFHGEPPKSEKVIELPDFPRELWHQGDVVAVVYKTQRDGKTVTFEHEFRPKSRPKLCVSPDGKQIYFVAGKYKVTDRGIEDR